LLKRLGWSLSLEPARRCLSQGAGVSKEVVAVAMARIWDETVEARSAGARTCVWVLLLRRGKAARRAKKIKGARQETRIGGHHHDEKMQQTYQFSSGQNGPESQATGEGRAGETREAYFALRPVRSIQSKASLSLSLTTIRTLLQRMGGRVGPLFCPPGFWGTLVGPGFDAAL
jgi:hypothetical protein